VGTGNTYDDANGAAAAATTLLTADAGSAGGKMNRFPKVLWHH